MPAVGSFAKVWVLAQFAPVVGRAAGQPACVQSKLVQSQVFPSEHVHELHASCANSPGVQGESPEDPALPIEPAAPDEPAMPVDPATPEEPALPMDPAAPDVPAALMVPAVPAEPASFMAPTVALLPVHANATQLDTAPNPSHHSLAPRFI